MDPKNVQSPIQKLLANIPESQRQQVLETLHTGSLDAIQQTIRPYVTGFSVDEVGQIIRYAQTNTTQIPQQTTSPSEEMPPEEEFVEGGKGILESAAEVALHHKEHPEDTVNYLERERQQVALLKEFQDAGGDEAKVNALLEKMGVFSNRPDSLIADRTLDLDTQLLALGKDAKLSLTDEQKAKLEQRRQKFAEEKLKQNPPTDEQKKRRESLVKELLDPKTTVREKVFRQLMDMQLDQTLSVESLLQEEQVTKTMLGRIPGLKNNRFLKRYLTKTVRESILSKKQLKAITKAQDTANKKAWEKLADTAQRPVQELTERIPEQEPIGEDIPEEMPTPESVPAEQPAGDMPNLSNPMQNAGDIVKDITKLGGGGEAAGGAGAELAVATAPEWGFILAIIGVIILIIIIIVVLIVFLQNQGGNPYTAPTSFAVCGDGSIGASDANLFAKEFNKRYQKNRYYGITLTAGGGDNATLLQGETEFYTDLCVLFGHLQGFTYKPDVYNTFGTLVMGSPKQIQDMQSVGIHITITAADTTDPCYFKLNSISGDTPSWTFFYNSSCSPEKARFLITQNLAHDLILQQQHLAKIHATSGPSAQVFNNFSSTYGSNIMTKTTLLPTNDCFNNINYGENAKDQQNRDCFADMAATYATYPKYYDSPNPTTPPTPTPTTGVTPTTTTKLSGTLSPTPSLAFTSPLSNFPDGNYKEYYAFAKDNLFDGVDFYTSSNSSLLTWADTIDKRLTKAGGTNFDQFTPSANQDIYHPEMLVNPIKGDFVDSATGKQYIVKRRGTPGDTDPMNKLRYWCTDFVIDVFNLASGQRILGENLGMVVYMQQFFAQQSTNPKSNLGFLNYDKSHFVLADVKPGAAIFFLQYNDGKPHEAEHTGIVTDISVNSHGNGHIDTDEANNMGSKPQYVYPVYNWNIEDAPFPVRGFGFIK